MMPREPLLTQRLYLLLLQPRSRWASFARRHPKVKCPTVEDRVLDLAKGMQAHFEPDTPYTPLSEWLHLARILARVLGSGS